MLSVFKNDCEILEAWKAIIDQKERERVSDYIYENDDENEFMIQNNKKTKSK